MKKRYNDDESWRALVAVLLRFEAELVEKGFAPEVILDKETLLNIVDEVIEGR